MHFFAACLHTSHSEKQWGTHHERGIKTNIALLPLPQVGQALKEFLLPGLDAKGRPSSFLTYQNIPLIKWIILQSNSPPLSIDDFEDQLWCLLSSENAFYPT